jgi:predicted double-glycine peptidase
MKPFHLLISILFFALASNGAAYANDFGVVGGNGAFSLKVSSFKSMRFNEVVAQNYDYSCGSAALATLLNYHYDKSLSEQVVLDAMYAVGDKKKIKSKGFSLLDMKNYLASLGYKSDGFKISLKQMEAAGVPGIVLINSNGYLHFVVVKGMNRTHVLLGDPALGMRKVSKKDFEKMWNNVFFIIRNKYENAKLITDDEDKWSGRKKSLFSTALSNQSLSTFTVQTAVTPNIYNK